MRADGRAGCASMAKCGSVGIPLTSRNPDAHPSPGLIHGCDWCRAGVQVPTSITRVCPDLLSRRTHVQLAVCTDTSQATTTVVQTTMPAVTGLPRLWIRTSPVLTNLPPTISFFRVFRVQADTVTCVSGTCFRRPALPAETRPHTPCPHTHETHIHGLTKAGLDKTASLTV